MLDDVVVVLAFVLVLVLAHSLLYSMESALVGVGMFVVPVGVALVLVLAWWFLTCCRSG